MIPLVMAISNVHYYTVVNLGLFVGVDLYLWPTVFSRYRADTNVKWNQVHLTQ